MPSRDWRLRIQDILECITEILQRTAGIQFEDFIANRTIVKAVLYDFGIIGEAARNIPSNIQSRYPQIPWRLMADMRAKCNFSRILPGRIGDCLENNSK